MTDKDAMELVLKMFLESSREVLPLSDAIKQRWQESSGWKDAPDLVIEDVMKDVEVIRVKYIDCSLNGSRFNSLLEQWEPSMTYILVASESMFGNGRINVLRCQMDKQGKMNPGFSSVYEQNRWAIDPHAYADCESAVQFLGG